MIKLISEATLVRDNKLEERDRAVLEVLQNIQKNSDPAALRVKDACVKIDGIEVVDGVILPPVILGKEFEWKISFRNKGNLPAKKVEIGLKFPLDVFEVKKQSGYSLYEPENIARFENEYIQKNTHYIFSPALAIKPKRTGNHDITVWVKGENIDVKFFTVNVSVEIEA